MKKKSYDEILKEYPGLAPVKSKTEVAREMPRQRAQRRAIVKFAERHGFTINPAAGYDYYVESFLMFGYCPCDKTRKACPCEQAVSDVQATGHCLCRLFWADYKTFREAILE